MIIMKNLFWIMIDRMMTIGVISIGNSQLSRIRLMAGALIDTKYMYVNRRLNFFWLGTVVEIGKGGNGCR